MKNENPTDLYRQGDETPVHPALTNALRAAIMPSKLQGVLEAAGATKFRGTPTEVLEEIAAAQTAAWIVGALPQTMGASATANRHPEVVAAAKDAIDSGILKEAAKLLGVRGDGEFDLIRLRLTSTLALTAYEAARVARAEGRPVCHNCVAVGGLAAVREAFATQVEDNPLVQATR